MLVLWVILVSNSIYSTFPGRVCVPIDPNCCEEFDPTAVPTLSKVNLYGVIIVSFPLHNCLPEGKIFQSQLKHFVNFFI